MNIVVFGASGGTGLEVVKRLLGKDYRVVAFVRDPARFPFKDSERLAAFRGDVLNQEQVDAVIAGCDAVVSVLGAKLTNKNTFICSKGIRNIIAAMKKTGAKRLIAQSAYGVKETRKGFGVGLAWFVLGDIMRDKELMEDEIERSGLDWTIVRPVKLTNGRFTGAARRGTDLKIRFPYSISRTDVADFIVSELVDQRYVKQKVIISD